LEMGTRCSCGSSYNSHASASPPLASLHNSAESRLLSLLCHP
jgi:hypothetical protein